MDSRTQVAFPELPPGFTLLPAEASAPAAQELPPLPPGFTVQTPIADQRVAGGFETAEMKDASGQVIADQRLSTDPKVFGGNPTTSYGFRDAVMDSLPFGDEIAAAGAALGEQAAEATGLKPGDKTLSESYDQAKALRKRYAEEYSTENPGKALAGEVLGTATIGPARAAAGAFAPAVEAAPTVLGRIGQGIKGGAGVGALYGAGEGDGALDRAENALKGAVGGVAVGATLPAVVSGVGGLVRRAVAPATSALGNRLTPGHRAASIVEENLRRDGLTAKEAIGRLAAERAVNPDVVLADIGGKNTRGLARAAVNTPGAAGEEITQFVHTRNLNQPNRIVEAVRTTLRNPADFSQTVERLAAEREHIASPIYEQAFSRSRPVNVWPVVKAIDKQINFGGKVTASALAEVRPDGITGTLIKMRQLFRSQGRHNMDLRQLHQIKMEMDDMVNSAQRGGDNTKARAVLQIKNELLRAMDKASRLYRRARGIYSSSYEMQEALDVGRSVFRMSHDDIAEMLKSMNPGQKEMVQIGSARAIYDQIQGVRDGRDVVKQLFSTPKIRDVLRTAFQDDQAYRRFRSVLEREAGMRRTADAVTGNSTTAAQGAAMADLNSSSVGRDVFSQLLEGRPIRAFATAVRQVIFGEKGINEKVAERIANLLLSNDPQAIEAGLRALQRRQGAVERLAARLAAIQRVGTSESTAGISRNLEPPAASAGAR